MTARGRPSGTATTTIATPIMMNSNQPLKISPIYPSQIYTSSEPSFRAFSANCLHSPSFSKRLNFLNAIASMRFLATSKWKINSAAYIPILPISQAMTSSFSCNGVTSFGLASTAARIYPSAVKSPTTIQRNHPWPV